MCTEYLGKTNGSEQYHQYKLYYSLDGKKWNVLVDKTIIKLMYRMNM